MAKWCVNWCLLPVQRGIRRLVESSSQCRLRKFNLSLAVVDEVRFQSGGRAAGGVGRAPPGVRSPHDDATDLLGGARAATFTKIL